MCKMKVNTLTNMTNLLYIMGRKAAEKVEERYRIHTDTKQCQDTLSALHKVTDNLNFKVHCLMVKSCGRCMHVSK